jgi:hypothetical protein
MSAERTGLWLAHDGQTDAGAEQKATGEAMFSPVAVASIVGCGDGFDLDLKAVV